MQATPYQPLQLHLIVTSSTVLKKMVITCISAGPTTVILVVDAAFYTLSARLVFSTISFPKCPSPAYFPSQLPCCE